jgi:hypothetical protein
MARDGCAGDRTFGRALRSEAVTVTWEEFLHLPERPESGKRYELQDGEVILVPPAQPLHIKLQKRIERLMEAAAGDRGVIATEFPYRPVQNLQYWFADVAYIPQSGWEADRRSAFAVQHSRQGQPPANCGPLSRRGRILGGGCRKAVYSCGDAIPLRLFGGASIFVDEIFGV